MTWTIWRYILGELWRLLVMATLALTLVTSLAATAKPLLDGQLGLGTAVRFMLYAAPPMMQYSVPFAACFAAVLTYHRLLADHELTAARAGGVSYRRILAPAACTGLVLAALLFVLGEWVIPRFLRNMQTAATQDVAQLIRGTINEGRPLDLSNAAVLAEEARALGPDAESGAFERLMLTRPVALQLSKTGAVEGATTASVAWVWLKGGLDEESGENNTSIEIYLPEATSAQNGVRAAGGVVLRKDVLGSLRDSPKYMTFGELRALPGRPERSNVIDRARRELALRLARDEVAASMDQTLRSGKRLELRDSEGRVYSIAAAGVRTVGDGSYQAIAAGKGDRLEIERRSAAGGEPIAMTAQGITIRHESDVERLRGRLSMTMVLSGLTLRAGGGSTGRPELTVGDLSPTMNPLPELLAKGSRELLEVSRQRLTGPGQGRGEAGGKGSAESSTGKASSDLQRGLRRIGNEVMAKMHERAAIAVSCFIMVVCGAVSALRLEGKLPLTVYAWCFVPALISVLAVNAGQGAAIAQGWPGLLVMWGGLAGLAAYTLWSYQRVTRF